MLKFAGKLLLFLIPIAIFAGFPVWVALRTGELMSDNAIVAAQESTTTPILVGLAMSNPSDYLHLREAIARAPQVLVLGSSRVQSIRSDFFTDPAGVYIASNITQRIGHFQPFIDDIPPGKTPKVLILGLDQKFFDPNYDSLQPDNIQSLLTQPMSAADVFSNWPMIYGFYFKRDFTIGELLQDHSGDIGLGAVMDGIGFRNDGSYDPGKTPYAKSDPNLAAITPGGEGFEYASTVSAGAVAELDALLADCKAKDITVIGYLPPFSPQAYGIISSMPPQDEGYMAQIMPTIGPVFGKYGDTVYDFSDPGPLGITQSDMLDSVHPAERGSLKYFSVMAAEDPVLKRYTDPKLLAAALNATTTEFNVLGR